MTDKIKPVLYKLMSYGSCLVIEDADINMDDYNPLGAVTFDPVTRSFVDKSEITPEYLEKLAEKGRQYLDEGNDFLAEECFRIKDEYKKNITQTIN